jgi:SAM-dependent methyltransferase
MVPLLINLLKPKSILDVGCGEGAWLSVFSSNGVEDYFGIDGDYVDRTKLLIDRRHFAAADLEKPFSVGRAFDLVICLEVAEHLSAEFADQFIASLINHSECVVFSASVPFQDGTNHVNEQWPSYWAEKFRKAGFNAYDCIRSQVWNHPKVRWWFSQNTIVYATTRFAAEIDGLGDFTLTPLPLVHPQLLLHKEERLCALRSENPHVENCSSIRRLLRQSIRVVLSRFAKRR